MQFINTEFAQKYVREAADETDRVVMIDECVGQDLYYGTALHIWRGGTMCFLRKAAFDGTHNAGSSMILARMDIEKMAAAFAARDVAALV